MNQKMPPAELQKRRTELACLARKYAGDPDNMDETARFGLDTREGQALYAGFSDEELLGILRDTARELGHSPAQNEVFWVYRRYLRARFKNWPTALRLAGLSRAAGKCGKPMAEMLQEEERLQASLRLVREKSVELGRTPHPTDLPEACEVLKQRYQTWGEVLTAAGAEQAGTKAVSRIEDLEAEYRVLLEGVRSLAESLNRAPLRKEVDDAVRAALIRRCGSWRNALYQIGLEPVKRISPFANTALDRPVGAPRARHRGTLYDCHYRILHRDEQTQKELELVARTAQRLGHLPGRRDIPVAVRRHLQEVCGSWSNALYQLEPGQAVSGEERPGGQRKNLLDNREQPSYNENTTK